MARASAWGLVSSSGIIASEGVSGPARRVRHATRSRSSVRKPHEAANSRENTVTTFSTAASPTP